MLLPPSQDQYTVCIFCALPTERTAMSKLFDKVYSRSNGYNVPSESFYTLGEMAGHRVVLAQLAGLGKVHGASRAAEIYYNFPGIKLAMLVGICGSMPHRQDGTEILPGDILIASRIFHHDAGGLEYNMEGLDPIVEKFVGVLQTRQSQMQRYILQVLKADQSTSHFPISNKNNLFRSDYPHKHRRIGDCPTKECIRTDGNCELARRTLCQYLGCDTKYLAQRHRIQTGQTQPIIHFGAISSGDIIIKSAGDRNLIAQRGSTIGFEMEAAGIWEQIPCVVVKSVSDFADSHKNDSCHVYAMTSAAACAKALLHEWASNR